MRRIATWIPILTLAAIVAGFLARRSLAPPRSELVIEPPPDAEIAALELPPRGASLAGRVVDADGAGVAEAFVWLRAGDEPHWTTTASDGSYRFDAVEAGPWHATVLARGYLPVSFALEDAGAAETLRLGPHVDPPPSLPPVERRDLAGTVSRSSGKDDGLEGFEVVLLPALPPTTLSGPLPRSATVDASGRFEIDGLILGEYRVEVRPAWARGGTWPDLLRPLEGGEPTNYAHAAPGASGDAGSELALSLATGEITGKLVDIDFATVEGALVLLATASDPGRLWPPASSAEDGSFAFRDLPAGRYAITVRAGSATHQRELEVRVGERVELDVVPLEVRRAR